MPAHRADLPTPRARAGRRRCLGAAASLLAAAIAARAQPVALVEGERLVHVERSAWQTLVVTDSPTRRCLRFGVEADALSQSCRLHAAPAHLAFDYTRAMVAALLLWRPAPTRVLLIGVGGGSMAQALVAARPALRVDAVDIDPAVLDVAQRFFDLTPGPRLRLHAADGRAFVAQARARGERYGAVLLDAFDAEGIPPALFGEDFLREVRALLVPGGAFLANTHVHGAGYAHETAAAARVFGRLHRVRAGPAGGNRLLLAAATPARLPDVATLLASLPAEQAVLAQLGIDAAWVRQLDFAAPDPR